MSDNTEDQKIDPYADSPDQADMAQLQSDLNKAQLIAEENLAGWKRTQADLENYIKRKEGENEALIQFGKQASVMAMLPVLDSLEQALLHAPTESEVQNEKYVNWKQGLVGIVKQIESTLSQMGIQKIEAVGKSFDPNLHEAVKEVFGDQDGKIAEQYQTGYLLNGKLLRPAQVAITKKG